MKLVNSNLMVVAFSALVIALAIVQHQQTVQVNRDSYVRCQDRQVNVTILNNFARKQAALETRNHFIGQKLVASRIALYKSLVLKAPKCGGKP